MTLDGATLAAIVTSVLGLIGGVIGSYFMWHKAKNEQASSDSNELREDLLSYIDKLNTQLERLQQRVGKLEDDVIEKNKEILRLQNYIGRLAKALISKYQIHINDLIEDQV